MRKEQYFQQIMLGPLDIHMGMDEVEPIPHIIHKNNSKMDQRLECKAKTVKL